MSREWATEAYAALVQGRTVQVRPRGDSMKGRIADGALVTIAPCRAEDVAVGDAVLARVRGWLLVLHVVREREADRFLIGTAAGRTDGWVAAAEVFGRVTHIEPAT